MQIKKALITAAGPDQRKLAMQTLVDRDGNRKTVLEILIEEARQAGIEEIAVVIHQGDLDVYNHLGVNDRQVRFIEQDKPLGYGYAVGCGASFVGNDYFLHLVGDHLYVNRSDMPCARHLVDVARQNNCSVSAVTPTRENLIPHYGTVGGKRIHATTDLYLIDKVIEKPTPTLAEQKLIVPGLRAGHYLCFFGMHVLSPMIMEILGRKIANLNGHKLGLSEALNELASREQYLALEKNDWRFDTGSRYGLLKAQLALALSGNDRDQLMSELLELFVMKNINSVGR
ncbi:MAG: NTP transferase domain-containing protein [Verrucomicrobia bacterium]|nr:NTP transferase domain-containing protein [Prolixibacteraceae bacterium]